MTPPRPTPGHLRRLARRVPIEVPTMPLVMVVRKACAHYNEMHPDKPDVEPSAVPLNPAFVERICVNYLRHSTTRYDRNRDAVRMMADSRAAREEVGGIIKARTLAAIAVAYPTLAAEGQYHSTPLRADVAWADHPFCVWFRSLCDGKCLVKAVP